jgi:hypothetical protein
MTDYERGLIVGVLPGLRLACVVFGRSFARAVEAR